MSPEVFGIDVLVTFILAAALLWRYSNVFRQRIVVTLSVLVAWYFSFLIIFILPLDVSSTVYRNCENQYTNFHSNVTKANNKTNILPLINQTDPTDINGTSSSSATSTSTTATTTAGTAELEQLILDNCRSPESILGTNVLYDLWRVVYWSSQFLTWIILPLIQSYTQAGEFTFWGKLKSSIWDNAVYYCSYLFIALILIIYIAVQPGLDIDGNKLKAIAAAASNTWGLTLLVFMLGYGLVEVPTQLWNSSKRGYRLNQAYFKVSKLWGERSDAEGDLEEALGQVEAISRQIDMEHENREFVDIILGKVPIELLERVKRRRTEVEGGILPDEKHLAKLHKRVNFALQAHRRTEAQWQELIDRVYSLEDQLKNSSSIHKIFKPQIEKQTKSWYSMVYTPMVEWYWECRAVPFLYRTFAGLACVMSVMLTWSEVTFFNKSPPLSLFALFISAGSYNHDYPAIEIISFITIMYMCICAYYTIFKVRVLNYYYLASNHQSDEYTLLFSGALLSRLTPPLCLNFLSLIHMDSHVLGEDRPETAYTKVMGHMDVVSIVSDYFNIYFPILLIILTVSTYLSLGSRFLSSLGFQQFLMSDNTSGELVEEGKELIKREKRRRGKLRETGGRRTDPEEGTAAEEEEENIKHMTSSRQVPSYSGRLDQMEITVREPPRNIFDDL